MIVREAGRPASRGTPAARRDRCSGLLAFFHAHRPVDRRDADILRSVAELNAARTIVVVVVPAGAKIGTSFSSAGDRTAAVSLNEHTGTEAARQFQRDGSILRRCLQVPLPGGA